MSPKGWAGAGVGIGTFWGMFKFIEGIPLIEIKEEIRMLKFTSLEITKFPIHVLLKILIPYSRFSRMSNSCFVEDLDPILKISKNFQFMFS